ncbi:hypothetical protein [Scytonema sp. PCC 10023]|uniref:hypothetical protein n=1 Tax=Scytonema sp. PCC 10023 TaxID=1680591 RepID=UPI0039C5F1DF
MAKSDDTEMNSFFTIRIWKKSSIGTQYTSDQHNAIDSPFKRLHEQSIESFDLVLLRLK